MDNNFFTIRRTAPGDFYLELHSINDDQKSRIISLTNKKDFVRLQKEYAMWIFFDPSLYKMFKEGCFTFDNDIEDVIATAVEEGVYFEDKLDFTPATDNQEKDILEILKSGQKARIEGLLNRTNNDIILSVAVQHIDDLTAGTIRLLEQKLQRQLIIDEK